MIIHLGHAGINCKKEIFYNLHKTRLIEHAICNNEGKLTCEGAFLATTGKYTGRSPNDKFTVRDANTEDSIWWGEVNKGIDANVANLLHGRLTRYLSDKNLYVQDCYAGASKNHRFAVRVITENAWHALFVHNMFLPIQKEDKQEEFTPQFTVIHAPSFKAEKERDKTNSEAAIIADFANKRVLICGTSYAGEIKKSIFTVLNYLLPAEGILGMHCSANRNKEGESALFFGLSGTGKTTLSADPKRKLIGDDEHGWSDSGIFNFEGGCYAKAIRLSAEDEPEIFATTKRFGTVLENVVMDEETRELDLNSAELTENTRASYEISAIEQVDLSGVGEHPRHIVMLTCDAFGVLPPLARLSPAQAMYHFISGYTAKVAGTERGIIRPEAVFSACFGAPFMARHPNIYASLLGEKIRKHHVKCWLVNTGWSGGPYGVGKRMHIKWTRTLLEAALSGALSDVFFTPHPMFKIGVPSDVVGVSKEILDPRTTWADKNAYDEQAKKLVQLFHDNFKYYQDNVKEEIKEAGPEF